MVMAKSPVPGRVKTRLVPPYTPEQAAQLAEAALADTLATATACGADEVVVALDGPPGAWLASGIRVIAQRGDTFDERLAAAWEDVDGAGVQIGMDTPQVTVAHLDDALHALVDHDSALGLAEDGGWWAIALHRPDRRVFAGVRMSRPDTGPRQLQRLRCLGHTVALLPALRDVDLASDVNAVASLAPASHFARAVAEIASS